MPLFYLTGGDQEVVQLELIFPGGRVHESKPLTAQLAARLLKEGTTSKSAAEIAELTDFHGAHLQANAGYDNATLSLVCLKKHLAQLLPLVKDILNHPQFSEQELAIQQRRSIQQLVVNQEKTDYLAQRLFHQKVFGLNHPYGYSSSKEKYESITTADLNDFYTSNKGILYGFAAGKIDTATLDLLQHHLCDIKTADSAPQPAHPLNTTPGQYHQERENAQQSSIRLGKPMISLQHPDYASLQVLNVLFGGYFGSRLMSNIREDKGFTYGIYSSLGNFKQTGYWMIGTEVGKTVAKDALAEIYKEIKRLQEEPIPDSELELVKNYIMGSYLSRVDGPFAQAKVHRGLIEHQQTIADFQQRIQRVLQTTPKRLMELAKEHFNAQDFVEVVVG